MKYQIAMLLALLCAAGSNAQGVNYRVLNRTDSLSPLKVSVVVEARNIVGADGLGLMAEGVIANRFSYSARWAKFFFNMANVGKDAYNTPAYEGLKKGSLLELGGEWYVASGAARDKRLRVVTSSSYSYGATSWTERYFTAKVPRRRILLLRGGVNLLNQPVFTGSKSDYQFRSGADSIVPKGDSYYYSNTTTTTFYGGIGYRKLYKAKVKAGDWGYFKFKSWKMYADVLSGTISYGSVKDAAGIEHNNITLTQNDKIGYRLGMEEEMMGVTTNIEIGKWPGAYGVFSFYNYLNLSFRFNVWGGDKRYKLKGR
jgi:hypothetical protein